MRECGETYLQNLSSALDKSTEPQIPFFSSTYGSRLKSNLPLDASYWRANLERPVRFDTAVRALLKSACDSNDGQSRIMLEIGPHSTLAGPLRQISSDTKDKIFYSSSLVRHRDGRHSMLEAIGQLWVRSVPIRLGALFDAGGKTLTDLPPYPWFHEESFWEENRISKQWRFRKELPHEILGCPVLEWNETEPTWRNILSVEDVSWLGGHKIVSAFPCSPLPFLLRILTPLLGTCSKHPLLNASDEDKRYSLWALETNNYHRAKTSYFLLQVTYPWLARRYVS